MNVNDQANILATMMRRITSLERAVAHLPDMMAASRTRLTAVNDATLTSTDHAFQVGPDDGPNMRIDPNEIMAADDGATGTLLLQNEGGQVRMGTGGLLRVYDDKSVTDDSFRQFTRTDTSRTTPQLIQCDSVTADTDANGEIAVTFEEAYTTAPVVVASRTATSTSDRTLMVRPTVSTTGFTVRIINGGTVVGTGVSSSFDWVAIGPKTNV